MNFQERILPVPRKSVWDRTQEGWLVWCASMVEGPDGRFYTFYSRWPAQQQHNGWVTHSQIAVAVSEDPFAAPRDTGLVLGGSGNGWDAHVTHNPQVIRFRGKYLLVYTGNWGNGAYWDHRNHQMVGLMTADHPLGPWTRFDRPLLPPRPGMHDGLLTSNPAMCPTADGQGLLLIYKAVAEGQPMPKGGAVVCGAARCERFDSARPFDGWVRSDTPIFVNPQEPWSVEDPTIWHEDGRYWVVIKDFQGAFTGTEKSDMALFKSEDGFVWTPAEHPLAMPRALLFEDGVRERFHRLERPTLMLRDGKPAALCLAGCSDPSGMPSFNVRVPLR